MHAGLAIEVLKAALPVGAEALLNLALAGNELAQALIGNTGANVLSGLGGADVRWGRDGANILSGGSANARLIGGAGEDPFVFDATSGWGRITDFALGVDRNELQGLGRGYGALTLTLTDTAAGVRIAAGPATIVLTSHLAAKLSVGDFLFLQRHPFCGLSHRASGCL